MVVTAVIEDLPSNTHLAHQRARVRTSVVLARGGARPQSPMLTFGGKSWDSQTYFLLKQNEPIGPLRESIRTLFDRHAPIVGRRKGRRARSGRSSRGRSESIHLTRARSITPDAAAARRRLRRGGNRTAHRARRFDQFRQYPHCARGAPRARGRRAQGARRVAPRSVQAVHERVVPLRRRGAVLGLAWPPPRCSRSTRSCGARSTSRCSRTGASRASRSRFLALVALLAGRVSRRSCCRRFAPRPSRRRSRTGGAHAGVRQALVVLQFAMLIALLIATTVTYRQMALGMREALRQNTDPIVVVLRAVHAVAARARCCAAGRARRGVLDGFAAVGLSRRRRRSCAATPRRYRSVICGLGLRLLRALRVSARGRSVLLRRARHGADAARQRLDAPGVDRGERDGRTAARLRHSAEEAVGQIGHVQATCSASRPRSRRCTTRASSAWSRTFRSGRVRGAIPPAVFFVDEGQRG